MATCDVVVVLITCPDDDHVESFPSRLVDERLAAGVHVLPAGDSVYRWGGAVERARERQLVVKTTQPRMSALHERVQELHPYETPEFLWLPVSGGDDRYLAWVHALVGVTRIGDDKPPADVPPGA